MIESPWHGSLGSLVLARCSYEGVVEPALPGSASVSPHLCLLSLVPLLLLGMQAPGLARTAA